MSGAAFAQTSVVTQHNDISRTGQNLQETTLTPGNVSAASFGRLFSIPVDGYIYAQPLYLPGLSIPGKGTHNVVFIATEHDSVYAFDADSNAGSNATPLWHITLLDAAHGAASGATTEPYTDVGTTDTVPEIGITGTPVIDTGSGTMYLVGQTVESGKAIQRLHALDIRTGAEKFGGPVAISASVPGRGNGSSGGILDFDPKWQYNRAGLLLLNGIVYIGFGSHGDNGPWHGWVLAYNATTLTQTGAFCTTPNGIGSGVWAAGTGLAADVVDPIGHPFGRLFIATGNGSYNASSPYNNTMNFGDDHIRLDLANGALNPVDAFTPFNQQTLNEGDTDVGSGGILLLPDQAAGGHKHLLLQAGKQGTIYLVDRDAMGDYHATDNIVQELTGQTSGLWSVPAYWNGNVYLWSRNDRLKAYSFSGGTLSSAPTSVSQEVSGFPGSTPSISANGATNGIVWTIQSDAFGKNGPAILMAHDAENVATTLYSSNQNPTRDSPGNAVKFTVPTVVNGKVYVGAQYQFSVYGLLNGQLQAAAPEFSPASKSFNGTLSVTISDATPGASIYYTTDGSGPTEASTLYTGPITVTSTTTINALASAAGYLQSPFSSATYTQLTQVAAPTFSPAAGDYTSAQQVTISDTTPNATIYYTLDGSTPSTASLIYSGPITLSSTTTVKAIGVAAGLTNSPVASVAYFIQLGGTGINFGSGFANASSTMAFNGSTVLNGSRLQLTSGAVNQAASAFYNTPINIQSFTTDFTFQLTNAVADGITFTIQGKTPTSMGEGGGGLGYGPHMPNGTPGIPKSIAVKFDLYNNAGEGKDSTGLYTNGASPTIPSIDLTKTGIDLHSGDTMAVHFGYDGTNLVMTIKDTVTDAVYTNSWAVDIPSIVGGNSAYIGFTGGAGGSTAKQEILTWTFVSTDGSQQSTATPVLSPGSGTYILPQSVAITDATPGASIFYTTDGTTPTTSSKQYSGPIALSATTTINAIATAAKMSNSSVATATYTVQAATPTFSPAPGTYATAQTVSILDTTPNATIYYTLNGTPPTTSSTVYGGPITISSATTIQAIAAASGLANSPVATGSYSIQATVSGINFANGFNGAAGSVVFNGVAGLDASRLQLTNGGASQAGSAFFNTPVNIQSFDTKFTFQLTNPDADGFTFAIQGNSPNALGIGGGGLGYGSSQVGGSGGIPNSVAVKFDLYNNAGEGVDSTGLYMNGAAPMQPSTDLSKAGINLHSGNAMSVHIAYDGTTLAMTITDTVTNASYSTTWPVNIASFVGSNAAYVGFTGGTGGKTANQEILAWTFGSGSGTSTVATPVISPAAGTYTVPQSVTITDATPGASIFYTLNGSTPSKSSTPYTGPITIAATTTVKAIAIETGFTDSGIASATYTIQLQQGGIDFSSGFSGAASSITFNGSAALDGSRLQITNGGIGQAGSAFYNTPVNVQSFTTNFALQLINPGADGFTFTIQGNGPTALGPAGGGLGYGSDHVGGPGGIPNSVAIKFDLYNNGGEGKNSTGLYTNGASPTTPSTDLTSSGINLHSGNLMSVHIVYDGTNLAMTITDTVTNASFKTSWPVNIPATVGGNTAYAGFTGGTGGVTANQEVQNWTFTSSGSGTQTGSVNFGSGFGSATGSVAFNGSATLDGSRLQITNAGNQGGSAFYNTAVNVQSFTNNFTFQLTNPGADGFTFTIQGNSPSSLGPAGGGLGYGPDHAGGTGGIPNSVAVKFDLYNNAGEGKNSTGLYTNGATPTLPSIDLTNTGIDLHSGHTMSVHMTYNGTTLAMTITDTVTNASYSTSWPVNIPSLVGGNAAYAGFTGGTGGLIANQEILTWTLVAP